MTLARFTARVLVSRGCTAFTVPRRWTIQPGRSLHQGLSQKLLAGNSAVGYMGTRATRFTLPLTGQRSPWPSANFLLAEAGNPAAGDCIA